MAFEYQGFATLGVNLNRQKYGPLDISNVFTSEADLKYYLSKGTFTEGVSKYWYESADKKVVPYPYEGQVLATVINGVVNVYALALDTEGNFTTQEIAGKIEIDGKTIKLNDAGKLELVGLPADTANKTFVPSLVNGVLTWAEPDTSTAEGQAQEIEGLKARATALETAVNGKAESSDGAGDAIIGLVDKVAANTQAITDETSDRETADEAILGKIGKIAEDKTVAETISAAEQAAKDYADGLADNYDPTGAADTALQRAKTYTDEQITGIEVAIEKKENVDYIVLKNAAGNEVASVSASRFVQDSFLDDVKYEEGKIKFTWTMGDGSTKTDEVSVADFVQTYTAGTGLTLSGNEFSVDTSVIATVEALNAVSDVANAAQTAAQVSDAIDAKIAEDVATTYATQDALSGVAATASAAATQAYVDTELGKKINKDLVYTKSEVDTKIGTPGTPEIPAQGTEGEDGYVPKVDAVAGTGVFASTYSRAEVDALLDAVSGGSSETAASVKRQLDTYKSENDNRVALVEQKNGTQDASISANASAIDAINNVDTGILAKAKTYTDSEIADIASAYKAADTALGSRIDNISALITGENGINAKITALQNKDTSIDAELSSIKTTQSTQTATIAEHTTDIANLEQKDIDLAALIQGNTNKFASYSTTEQMNKAIDDKIAAIDNSGLEASIAQNASDIKTNADILAALIGTDSDKTIRAIAESEVAKVVNSAPEAFDTLKEVADWIENDETGAAAMSAAIATNTAAIAALNTAVGAISIATTEVAGLVKASETISVSEDGTMNVAKVSTDLLVQGTNELILYGGSAGTAVNA